jgi:hypothetical protein
MPRAAPGVCATGAMRRRLREHIESSVQGYGRRRSGHPPWLKTMPCHRRLGGRLLLWLYFTLHFTGYGVERGCLGEVVSLVGDCRPPPPGNPHRPPFQKQASIQEWAGGKDKSKYTLWRSLHRIKNTTHGEIILENSRPCTFNRYPHRHNLKELNWSQNFKNNCSYFYCTGKCPVLEFGKLHSHLCGLSVVELPSIAVTNVLES